MNVNHDTQRVATRPMCVGDAVGVERHKVNSCKWYVAFVGTNTEKIVGERLEQMNYEVYVATQTVTRVWKNGRRAKVDRVVIPSMVFIKCTEQERRQIVALPYIMRFLTNKAGTSQNGLTKPLATISQREIDTLRFMLGHSDDPITFTDAHYRLHDKVVITRGSLKGLEGEVIKVEEGRSEVIVRIGLLGCAKICIDTVNLRLLRENK